jgi:hypothetical protein
MMPTTTDQPLFVTFTYLRAIIFALAKVCNYGLQRQIN